MNRDFLNWLAGFIEGEGCFSYHRSTAKTPRPKPVFVLTLRGDDEDVVREIQRELCIGSIYTMNKRPEGNKWKRNDKPGIQWQVYRTDDCERLATLLSGATFHSKKARDFRIWCQLVEAFISRADTETLEVIANELSAVKKYTESEDNRE